MYMQSCLNNVTYSRLQGLHTLFTKKYGGLVQWGFFNDVLKTCKKTKFSKTEKMYRGQYILAFLKVITDLKNHVCFRLNLLTFSKIHPTFRKLEIDFNF